MDDWYSIYLEQIEQNGQMVFADTGRTPQNPMGSMGGGYIESDSLMKKNY